MNRPAAVEQRRVRLSDLLAGFPVLQQMRNDLPVEQICIDSRQAMPGSLFIALAGNKHDGHDFIADAIGAGATAVLCESEAPARKFGGQSALVCHVAQLRRYAGTIASRFYDHPSSKMNVVGITGTNGKTTVAWLCANALESLGNPCGMIGTLGSGFPRSVTPSSLTTPDAISIQSQLSEFVQSGARYACMEVSSHALAQYRPHGTRFHTVALTNIATDHLDYHANQDEYWNSKRSLFEQFESKTAVINGDQQQSVGMLADGLMQSECTITYGAAQDIDAGRSGRNRNAFKDIQIVGVRTNRHQLEVDLEMDAADSKITIGTDLVGKVNAINVAAAAGILSSLEIKPRDIQSSLSGVSPVPGRLERISTQNASKPCVYVDFAHTADALKNTLASLRELTDAKLWCVFGCGGERDTCKRPQMGRVAEQYADEIVITDDNPRHEPPSKIVEQILAGMNSRPIVEHDRARAIRLAISNAGPCDIVLIAGKGHEKSQIYEDLHTPFDDRELVRGILEAAA